MIVYDHVFPLLYNLKLIGGVHIDDRLFKLLVCIIVIMSNYTFQTRAAFSPEKRCKRFIKRKR